jgi:ATP-dependent helicase/nuclease subunit B
VTETKPHDLDAPAMNGIAKNDAPQGLRAFSYGPDHPAMALWVHPQTGLLARIAGAMAAVDAHPARTLVLLPYAQLLPLANRLWGKTHPDGFAPRFETTQNWAASVGGHSPAATDISFDTALDTLTAQALLSQSGLPEQDGLATLLVQAAHQLAPLAAAAGPAGRSEWAAAARRDAVIGMEGAALAWEAQVARVAVEWAAISGYASDALFDAEVVRSLDCLVVVQGLAADSLAAGLQSVWGDKLVVLPLSPVNPAELSAENQLNLHACLDAEDEAQRTAACALRHIAANRYPVALVSSDRALTRRVRAMLESAGVQMRDENGWKLSTSHAAAAVMALLRAAVWNASADAVLALVKLTPALQHTGNALEAALRRDQVRDWRHATASPSMRSDVLLAACAAVDQVRGLLNGRRPVSAWLTVLQEALQITGLWDRLLEDGAGTKVLGALRLAPADPAAWNALLGSALWAPRRMDLAEFTAWVNQALESASFQPDYPAEEEVVILPMSQMLGRPFAAVVLAGCDEVRLNPSPEPAGQWTPAQRAALGLPVREALDAQLRAAWQHALQSPQCDVLWRTSDDSGETLLPSSLVQLLQLAHEDVPLATDPRDARTLQAAPTLPPMPAGEQLAVKHLSASAYEDLRQCPYRFFALRQLGLKPVDELESEVDKRDFGVWLHAVLQHFHDALAAQPIADRDGRSRLLNLASEDATASMGLPEGEFLPFAAAWPAVREGYLDWLEKHELEGATFISGETSHTQSLGDLKLVGRIDRMDSLPDGTVMVLDYKTEPGAKTKQRVKDPFEDTQIAFYAALLPNDTLRAAYVNVGEREGTVMSEQPDVVHARDALIAGILDDMHRIAEGVVLPALGEGPACDYCQARGLCRKDFWNV